MTLRQRYAWFAMGAAVWSAAGGAMAQSAATEEISGTVVWTDPDSRHVAVRQPDAPETALQSAAHRVEYYRVADGAGIIRNGRWATLGAIEAGDRVAIRARPEDVRSSWPIAEAIVAAGETSEVTESGAASAPGAPSG